MSRFDIFLEFLREYFRGMGQSEYREMFICRGDPATAKVKDRGVVWIHGLDTYMYAYIKSTKSLKSWNIYMSVGFLTEHGLTTPIVEKMMYDRVSFDFDYEEDPDTAVSQALSFAEYLYNKYDVTPVVFESGFKGAHVVIPLSKPVDWEVYQLLWRKLYNEMTDQRKLIDTNMLQWNRVDRVPLTYNVKNSGVRFARIIYPREFSWEDFKWSELKPLDPERVKIVKVVVPRAVKPRVITASTGKSWIWRVVERGLPDGRKRFILYVLAPHLTSSGKSEDEIIEVCREFIENSCKKHNNCSKIYDSWLKSVVRSAKRHGFRGFSLNILRDRDPELYSLITEC